MSTVGQGPGTRGQSEKPLTPDPEPLEPRKAAAMKRDKPKTDLSAGGEQHRNSKASQPKDVNADENGGELELPEGYSYTSEDPLHLKITNRLKQIVGDIIENARENPQSEANEMVRAMLLNQVANAQPDSYQGRATQMLAEERRRGTEERRKAEMNRHNLRFMELRETALNQQIQERDQRLAKTKRELEKAESALEHGKPLDPRAVYRRISEIVGLRAPADQAQPANQ